MCRLANSLAAWALLVVLLLAFDAGARLAQAAKRKKETPTGEMTMRMPGKSYRGELPPLDDAQKSLRDALRRDLTKLAGEIGERNLNRPRQYAQAIALIEQQLKGAGYQVGRQTFTVRGRACVNIEVQRTGSKTPQEILVIGAHYDTVVGCPGANDNGTGTVALWALARAFADKKPARTVRFVAFANEEVPYYRSDAMGSLVYARRCRQRKENIVGMFSLETIGYFSDAKNSQRYPAPLSFFYPSTGNFIAFVGNVKSRKLVTSSVVAFRAHAKFPSEGGAVPGNIDGVGWSDHWSFWQAGYPALMVTDTAPFRYPHYHLPSDTPDKIDYDRMARVVDGLEKVIEALAGGSE